MTTTSLIAKIVGPVLLLRALSILIDRQHFVEMIGGLDREVATVSFSFVPIALMMAGLAILALHSDRSSPAAIMISLMAWGGIAKASALMLFPSLVASKALLLQRAGFLYVVLARISHDSWQKAPTVGQWERFGVKPETERVKGTLRAV